MRGGARKPPTIRPTPAPHHQGTAPELPRETCIGVADRRPTTKDERAGTMQGVLEAPHRSGQRTARPNQACILTTHAHWRLSPFYSWALSICTEAAVKCRGCIVLRLACGRPVGRLCRRWTAYVSQDNVWGVPCAHVRLTRGYVHALTPTRGLFLTIDCSFASRATRACLLSPI